MKKYLVFLIFYFLAFGHAQTYVELILDASGSMWNKLADDRYRIVAAKEVLSDFTSSLPGDPNLNVGLRIYGSQMPALEEGSCEDSRLFVDMKGIEREKLLSSINDANAQGATPIAYSLLEAAKDFPADAEKRVIVLVTDGEESCGGDLQAVAAELASQGINFDLRIIGFDLDDRAVESFEGIGTFENATSASELAEALGRAVEEVVVEVNETFPVTANVFLNGEALAAQVSFKNAVSNSSFNLIEESTGVYKQQLEPGTYIAEVVSRDGINQSFSDLSVIPEGENTFNFDLKSFAISLTVNETEALAGSEVSVSFEGAPAQKGDFLTLVPVETPDNVLLDTERPQEASGTVSLLTPDEATMLEARYITRSENGSRTVIARSNPFSTIALNIMLEAQAEVNAGAVLDINWSGNSNPNDFITIVATGEPERTIGNHKRAKSGQSFTLDAPVIAGDYELRYVTNQSRKVIASIPVKVLAISVSLDAPGEAQAGSSIDIAYSGEANEDDFITIVPADAPDRQVGDHKRVRDGNPVSVATPSEPGEYEVRYVTNQSPRQTLARLPLSISGLSVSLSAVESVTAGTKVEVSYTGASNENDFITVVAAGSEDRQIDNHRRVRDGNPVTVDVPATPGEYEIRYVTNQSPRTVYASIPLNITALEVSLDAETEARAGSQIEVTHTGAGDGNDFITIVPVGSEARQIDNHRRVKNGNPVTVDVTDIPGTYEIRYVTNASPRTVYASITLTINELELSLSAPPGIAAGETVMVTLTGKGNPNDFITIVPVGSEDRQINEHARVKGLDRGIKAPQEAGNYEIRYVTNQSRRVIFSVPITIQ